MVHSSQVSSLLLMLFKSIQADKDRHLGNLITLLACYLDVRLSPLVREFIEPRELVILVHQASTFINFVATRSSALAVDSLILCHMAEKAGVWFKPELDNPSRDVVSGNVLEAGNGFEGGNGFQR